MSNQEMQFAEPEQHPPQSTSSGSSRTQEPYTPQQVNRDPREQSQGQTIPPQQNEYGYRGEAPYIGPAPEKIGTGPYAGRRQSRRRRSPWLWVIIVLIVVAILGANSGWMMHGLGPGSSVLETRNFTGFTGTPTVVINDNSGNIIVQTGQDNNVSVAATQQSGGFLGNSVQVKYTQSKENPNIINVGVENGPTFFNSGSVNFTVTVPTNTNLRLQTHSGDLDVSNVTGQVALTTDSGSIDATGDTFTGPTTLQSSSGDITAMQDHLTSSSTLQTDSGSVTFNGSIGAGGAYQFLANSGDVDVTLPSNSPFHVDASTNSGSITSDFSQVTVQQNDSGATAQGNVGEAAPDTTVTMRTDSGSISLHQG